METLKVRHIIFHFDKKSDFRYDVNQNIKVIDLKRMIETALQIPRYKVKLYHNEIDYTEHDDSRLENLFPDLQIIEFYVALGPASSDEMGEKEIALKLRLGEYCDSHTFKYPCHFCFDCNKSFCSICNVENVHGDHETIEKYDYLQDTHSIVNRIFRRVSEDIKNLRFENEEKVHQFEAYLRDELFDKLRLLITSIEVRIKDILKVYLESSKLSLRQIESNLNIIKENCAEVLNSRKAELEMQNMLIDESVIINYYNTIMQIHNQKYPIENDKKKFSDLVESLSVVKPVADTIYNDIKAYLEEKLNVDCFNKCEQDILRNKIMPVSSDIFIDKLQKDILNSTNKKPLSAAKMNLLGTTDKKKFHHLDLPDNVLEFNVEKNFNVFKTIQNNNTLSKAQKFGKSEEKLSDIIKNTDIKQIFNHESTSNILEVDDSVWGKIENENFVFTLQPESPNVFVYSEQRQKVKKFLVKFPMLKTEKFFLKGCSWVNANGKLYVCGGMHKDSTLSNEFFFYDHNENSIKLLKELNQHRANHSMIFYDNLIYIVGGENSSTTEIYDVVNNTLLKKDNINFEQVDNPILWIHNGYLYSFFGIKAGKSVSFVQRSNLKLDNLKWEKVTFKKSADVQCNIYGSGIIPCGNSEIYFFGGKNENTVTNQSIIFNFETKEFSDAGVPLEQGQYFKDSRFIILGNQIFGQFSLTEYDNFLKINVSYA